MSRKSILAVVAVAALGTTFLIPTDASARSGGYAARSSHFAGVRSSIARATVSRSFAHPRINRGFAHPTVSRSPVVKWSRFTNHSVAGPRAAGLGSHIIWQRPSSGMAPPRSGKVVGSIPTPGPLRQPQGPVPGSPPAPSNTGATPNGPVATIGGNVASNGPPRFGRYAGSGQVFSGPNSTRRPPHAWDPGPNNENVGVKCYTKYPANPDPNQLLPCNAWDDTRTCDLASQASGTDEQGFFTCRPKDTVTGIPPSGPNQGYRCWVRNINLDDVSCQDFAYWGDGSRQACNLTTQKSGTDSTGGQWKCFPAPQGNLAAYCAVPQMPMLLLPQALICSGSSGAGDTEAQIAQFCSRPRGGWMNQVQQQVCPSSSPAIGLLDPGR
jgi:hypothetical protein